VKRDTVDYYVIHIS